MKRFYTLFLAVLFCCFILNTRANDTAYVQRQNAYISNGLTNFNGYTIVLQAYEGLPIDTPTLNNILTALPTNGTADFDIVHLVRILNFSNGRYDSMILPVLRQIPFWLTADDTVRDYWSENHMMQWISSDWLLHERYGWPVDSDLYHRVVHDLQLKVQYGYYEFFSTVYGPYCLGGLLNLADFAQDSTIHTLAIQASQLLLKRMLMITNDQGVLFPTAGRNYYDKYETAYGQNHNNLIYLLTGMGQVPGGPSHAGVILATSTLPVDNVISSWVPVLDTVFYNGHTLDSGFVINSSIPDPDKILLQWSSGAYFAPEVALESYNLITDSMLWNQVDFKAFAPIKMFPPSQVTALSQSLNAMSESSVISGETIAVFKHNSITLSSLQNFWPGKVGYQEFPCVANVGTTPVMTASGPVIYDWDARSADNANEDLPYVSQHKNVALLMYRPEPVPAILGYTHKQVSLFFQDSLYSEIRNDSLWLLGRQGNNYVAVRRPCLNIIDSLRACDTTGYGGETWVIMVGDSEMYGSFDNFQSIIDSSSYTEQWYYDSTSLIYYASITIDTTTISYAWAVDTSTATGIAYTSREKNFAVYPNPTTRQVSVNLSDFAGQNVSIMVTDLAGRNIFSSDNFTASPNVYQLNTSLWADGMYLLSIKVGQNVFTRKLIKD